MGAGIDINHLYESLLSTSLFPLSAVGKLMRPLTEAHDREGAPDCRGPEELL